MGSFVSIESRLILRNAHLQHPRNHPVGADVFLIEAIRYNSDSELIWDMLLNIDSKPLNIFTKLVFCTYVCKPEKSLM